MSKEKETLSEIRERFFQSHGKAIAEAFKAGKSIKEIMDGIEKQTKGQGRLVWYALVRAGLKSYAAEKKMIEADKAVKAKPKVEKPVAGKKVPGKPALKVANAKGAIVEVGSSGR
jgi:uncharacterized protein with gpF-like domain